MRKIVICIIAFILIGMVIIEEYITREVLSYLNEKAIEIQILTSNKENINTLEILQKVESLETKWLDYEGVLCFLVNHKDMQDMGVELAKLKANIAVNQTEDFKSSLNLIVFYSQAYKHFIGISLQNLF